MLTTEQIEHYHRDGYVTPDFRLDQSVIDDIRDAHDLLDARRRPIGTERFSDAVLIDLRYHFAKTISQRQRCVITG